HCGAHRVRLGVVVKQQVLNQEVGDQRRVRHTPNRTVEDFGSNEWLVEELYEQYKSDKNSVDKSWWPFFDKYEKNSGGSQTAAAKPAAKAADKSAAKSEAPATASSAPPAARENLRGVSPSSAESETLKAETKSV